MAAERKINSENKSGRETVFQRSVCAWVLRHFKPDPEYRSEPALTDEAPFEAQKTAREILEQISDGEIIVIYKSGPKPRHKATRELLVSELKKQVNRLERHIEIIELPDTKMYKQNSLRTAGFTDEYIEKAGGLENTVSYWLRTSDSMGNVVDTPEEVTLRLKGLINGLFRFTNSYGLGPKVNWILITSGEILAPFICKEFKVAEGLEPGEWVSFNVGNGGSLDMVEMKYWQGQSKSIDLNDM
ncbi:MAG: hypothetical protein M1268_04550 [Patescibacteria group bacterium]|nr:hypothetical protein [Patescibacteria group bacterium]